MPRREIRPLRRFLLFAGDDYYPCGGWADFVNDFDTLEEAKSAETAAKMDWSHIVDTTTGDEVES